MRIVAGVLRYVGQDVACALEQVVAQEQTSQRMLHAATHLHQVLEQVSLQALVGLDVHQTNRDQQVSKHVQISYVSTI